MAGQGSRSAMLVFLGTVAMVLLSCRGAAAATTYQVGNASWEFPASLPNNSDSNFYDDWSAKQQFFVGDFIEFTYDTNVHNVASLNSSVAFNTCDVSQANIEPITGTGETKIQLNTSGYKWYVCQVVGHCDNGMKVQIVVLPAVGAPLPGIAPNSGRSAEAPGPSNAAAPRFTTALGYGTAAAVVISAASFFL